MNLKEMYHISKTYMIIMKILISLQKKNRERNMTITLIFQI